MFVASNLLHFYEFGPFRLDAGEKLLYCGHSHVQLTLKAIHTLLILVQKSGQVVKKSELMDEVWPQIFVQESTLTQNIFILRKTLGKCTDGGEYIETVPRRGYRFNSVVREGWIERPAQAPTAIYQSLPGSIISAPGTVAFAAPLTIKNQPRQMARGAFTQMPARRLPKTGREIGNGGLADLEIPTSVERAINGNMRGEDAAPMDLMVTEEELKQLLHDVAFTRNYGFALASIGDGVCTISVPFQEAFERPGGIVSGQVYMAAADVAMWLAIKTKLGMKDMAVTAEQKTTFLAAAKQEDFTCSATILKMGRRLIYGTAECVKSDGTMLAHHTLTYIRQ